MKMFHIFLFVMGCVIVSTSHGQWVQDRFIIMNQWGDPTLGFCHATQHNISDDSIEVLLDNNVINACDSSNYQLFKDAHFNLIYGCGHDSVPNSPARYKYLLNIASRIGLKSLICDYRFFSFNFSRDTAFSKYAFAGWYKPFSQTTADEVINGLMNDNRPSVIAGRTAWYGYCLSDEPPIPYSGDGTLGGQYVFDTTAGLEKHRALASWMNAFNARTNDKFVYIKLLPIYSFGTSSWEMHIEDTIRDIDTNYHFYGWRKPANMYPLDSAIRKTEYAKYLQWHSGIWPQGYAEAPITNDVMQSDYYPFMPDTPDTTQINMQRREYCRNCKLLKEAAGDRPFWAHVMAFDHSSYINPHSQHLRHGAFVPIAYGAKGIGWYQYYCNYDQSWGHTYEREAIVTRKHNQTDYDSTTEKYDKVKAINNYIEKLIGPVVFRSANIGTYHVSSAPTGEDVNDQLINQGSYIINTLDNQNCMIGVFRDASPSHDFYGFVVRKEGELVEEDQDDSVPVSVKINGDYSGGRVSLTPSIVGLDTSATTYSWVCPTVSYNATTNTSQFSINLAHGDGRMFKVTMPENVTVSGVNVEGNVYEAINNIITGTNATFTNNNILRSSNSITLNPGTRINVTDNSKPFRANIDPVYKSNSSGKSVFVSSAIPYNTISTIQPATPVYVSIKNYPNPFRDRTKIFYTVKNKGSISIKVYDIVGRYVSTLVNEDKMPGNYEVDFKKGNLSSGVYFYRIKTNSMTITKKTLIIN